MNTEPDYVEDEDSIVDWYDEYEEWAKSIEGDWYDDYEEVSDD